MHPWPELIHKVKKLLSIRILKTTQRVECSEKNAYFQENKYINKELFPQPRPIFFLNPMSGAWLVDRPHHQGTLANQRAGWGAVDQSEASTLMRLTDSPIF